ncbi:MAG: selenium-binding family protein [Pseudomonadota bacterium]
MAKTKKSNGKSNGKSDGKACCGPGYASPAEAMKAPKEKLLYCVALYTGTGIEKPDYIATIDVDPKSKKFGKIIHRCEMPNIGDELHHIGWNACSSCHEDSSKERKYLIVPGVRSSRIHILDTATDPKKPRIHKVIEGSEIAEKTNLSAPHTVHCLGSDIIISMLGDAKGNAPGGFLHLNEDFEIVGRWEKDLGEMNYNYDFWYQPRHNTMVSSEWAAPNTFMPGFDLDDVAGDKYGHHIHFWDFKGKKVRRSVDLGEEGMIPLEVRFHHDPDSSHGFVAATLSSNVFHFYKKGNRWQTEKIIDVPPVDVLGWPIQVPSLITDILVSMDDKYLYFSNWLHGDLRQYDISDPHNPKFTGQVWIGGLLDRAPKVNGKKVAGAPQMIQLSLDGKRLYVTTSLFSTWDNQFYPEMTDRGSCMVQIDCDTENGGMSINKDFYVDFKKEPNGPARAHEMRYPGGDCTSDIWL